jgi:hypothetical protein
LNHCGTAKKEWKRNGPAKGAGRGSRTPRCA